MSLATGAKISRHQWTLVPITDATIARVGALAKQERQPLIQASGLVVEWRHDKAIDNDIYDHDYDSNDEPVDDPLDPINYHPITDDELANLLANGPPPPLPHPLASP
jgi:hypothetical protein